jgi:hypothetical protein
MLDSTEEAMNSSSASSASGVSSRVPPLRITAPAIPASPVFPAGS